MIHLLVVDDEENIRKIIKKYAEFEGYTVSEAGDGMEAAEMCRTVDYDLVIMDIMMPELDGFSASREIRKHSGVPIIMLSARGEEYDKIHGFELGIDDYVVKPFSPKELMMRVAAVIKRSSSESGHDLYRFMDFAVDFSAHIASVGAERLELSPKEYDLLSFLIRNRGIALSREKILNNVWGFDFYGDDRTLDTHIKLLRKKLGDYSDCISTVRGVGYRFEQPQN